MIGKRTVPSKGKVVSQSLASRPLKARMPVTKQNNRSTDRAQVDRRLILSSKDSSLVRKPTGAALNNQRSSNVYSSGMQKTDATILSQATENAQIKYRSQEVPNLDETNTSHMIDSSKFESHFKVQIQGLEPARKTLLTELKAQLTEC